MTLFGKPVTPKEHGAWVMLLQPMVIGALAVAPHTGYRLSHTLLLAISAVAGMFAVEPLRLLIKMKQPVDKARFVFWFLVYALVAGAAFAGLVAQSGRLGWLWFTIPAMVMAVVKLWSATAGTQRATPVELMGVVGLTLSAPAAVYSVDPEALKSAVALYLLCLAWSADRFLATGKILALLRSTGAIPSGGEFFASFKTELRFHTAGLFFIILVLFLFDAPVAAFIPFLLGTYRYVTLAFNTPVAIAPRSLGFSEMRLGIAFGAGLIFAFRIFS